TDAALLQVKGDTGVIACVAAELSALQVQTMKRRGIRSVTIALDPDSAGDQGILSCVRQLLDAGITPYVAPKLPDGLDPDGFVTKNGLEAWHAHGNRPVHGYRHQARRILAEVEAERGPHEPGDDGWNDSVVNASVEYARTQPAERLDELHRHFWG